MKKKKKIVKTEVYPLKSISKMKRNFLIVNMIRRTFVNTKDPRTGGTGWNNYKKKII